MIFELNEHWAYIIMEEDWFKEEKENNGEKRIKKLKMLLKLKD
jgi:hypothetical protein